MKKLLSLLLSIALIVAPAYAELGMSPAGGVGGSGGNPAGSNYQLQYYNNGSFGGLPSTAGSYTNANFAAMGAVSSGLIIDPRNYGATCAGAWYSIKTPTLHAAGTGYNPGDTFLVEADGSSPLFGNHMRGGKVAKGHVLTTSAGAVVTFAIDDAGTGYYAGNEATFATSGTGTGFQISYTVNTTPSAPTTSLVSGGNNWAVGDPFYVPNATAGNYMTGRVDSVTAGGVVATYHMNNVGGDYTINPTAPALAVDGLGTGLVINISSVTGNASNGTWDDTFGLMNASVASARTGGSVLFPDQCWGQNMSPTSGSTFFTPNIAPNYGFSDIDTSGKLVYVSSPTHFFIYGTPQFGIDFNGESALSFSGFEVRAYAPGAFGVTACIGSKHGGGLVGSTGLITPPIRLSHMSAKGCLVGLGSPDGTGSYLDVFSYAGDYGANQYGIYGPFSDYIFDQDTIASTDKGIWIPVGGGGLGRIIAPRLEYITQYGIQLDTGGLQTQLIGVQTDRTGKQAILINNASRVTMTGGTLKGAGLAGSLKVTGAANNGSGLIRLTVSGYGGNPNGCTPPCATSGITTGNKVTVSGVGGTTEANGTWTLTVVDGTHIDLQSSTFTNVFTSAGLAGVWNRASYIEVLGSAAQDFHAENVTFAGYSAGAILPASFIFESQGGTSTYDWISITDGSAQQGTSGNFADYMQSFVNWQTTAPAHYKFDVPHNNPCRTDNAVFSIDCTTGSVGMGTATPNTNSALDLGSRTTALILPKGTTAQEPTPTAGMCRYNSDTPGIECYYSSAWNTLGAGVSGIVRSVNVISSNTAAGSIALTDYVYLVSGTTTLTLPTAVGNTNQYEVINTGTNTVTIATTSAQTINGSATASLIVQHTALTLISDGSNWHIE